MTRYASARRGWYGAPGKNADMFRDGVAHPTLGLRRQDGLWVDLKLRVASWSAAIIRDRVAHPTVTLPRQAKALF